MTLYLSLGTGLPTLVGNILGGFIVEYFGYPALYGSYTVFAVMAAVLYHIIRIKLGPQRSAGAGKLPGKRM
ncbi:MAG: hypothetical protein LBI94_05630, partial [Treponema sp.]|jgi:PPP family 3-phenylpropionic acid transporter|nr:hypothetical protein [Treponema sp.]